MKTLKSLLFISVTLPSFTLFAAQPQVQLDLNPDGGSYTLRIDNKTETTINCTGVEISAEIGNQDCTKISPDFNQTIRNIKIPKGSATVDSSFGKDHLFLVNRKLKPEEAKVFCGQPEVKFNCQ